MLNPSYNKTLDICAVIGVDIMNGEKIYRVLMARLRGKEENYTYDWKFKCDLMGEQQLIASVGNGSIELLNFEVGTGGIKGRMCSLDRFNANKGESRPVVIISQITTEQDEIIGYKVATYDGRVKNISIKEMLSFGSRLNKIGDIPVQNAMFVPTNIETGKKAYFRSYGKDSEGSSEMFVREVYYRNKNPYTQVNKERTVGEVKQTATVENDIYTKEQLKQLKLGKDDGVDIRIYAKPELSAEQMTILRSALKLKLPVKPLAHHEYAPDVMKYYITDLINGMDIRKYLNPKYNIGQLSEISIAVEEGLDVSKMANPDLDAVEMCEIRERLENNIWKDIYDAKGFFRK